MSVDEAPGRPALTISEAARASGRDRRTIRRYLDQGRFDGAYRDDEDGYWRLPVAGLIGAGFRLNAPEVPTSPGQDHGRARRATTPHAHPMPGGRDEVEEWKRRAMVAEAVAEERERTIEALQSTIRALGAGSSGGRQGAASAVMGPEVAPRPENWHTEGDPVTVPPPRRARWWQRAGQ